MPGAFKNLRFQLIEREIPAKTSKKKKERTEVLLPIQQNAVGAPTIFRVQENVGSRRAIKSGRERAERQVQTKTRRKERYKKGKS